MGLLLDFIFKIYKIIQYTGILVFKIHSGSIFMNFVGIPLNHEFINSQRIMEHRLNSIIKHEVNPWNNVLIDFWKIDNPQKLALMKLIYYMKSNGSAHTHAGSHKYFPQMYMYMYMYMQLK